ncbi:MAG: ATP-binding protein [Candidatus Electryonea clarkiae]|nr:ATP-binding protein [Candidatus Electryonea clarkiae]MDP8287641.1 ATP-binding protein [Candidatus Electryonea clarkiae]
MKTITIVSGKGGTGKTSIISSFAALASPTALADCDVDAADLHLMLHPDIKKINPFSGAKVAEIDMEKCSSCDLCHDLCRFEAIDIVNMSYKVDHIACEGCGVCAWFCPEQAIELVDEPSGEWYISETAYGPMVHAKLGIAAENSGRLVTIVRNFAKGIGETRDIEYMLVDGSPGIGCPVIASITGVDFALIVTEPTLSGQHDMERIAELTAHFDIPTRICINKWDINKEVTKNIEEWGERTGNKIIGKVRFDNIVTEAMVQGIPVVEYSKNGISGDIESLWSRLKKELNSSIV